MKKIAQRFCDVWKLDFLANYFAGDHKDHKTTLVFWILFNTVVVFVLSVSFFLSFRNFSDELITKISVEIPDGARITIADGQLMTEGIDEPYFREFTAKNAHNNALDETYAVIINTRSDAYDIASLDEYMGGILILHDRIYAKNGNEIKSALFADVENFSITKEDVLDFINAYAFYPTAVFLTFFVFVTLFFVYAGMRLVMGLWWALMLFVLAQIFDIRVQYVVAYKAVLNLYVIPTIVVLVLNLFDVHVALLTSTIFVAVFIANLIWMKKKTKKETIELPEIPVKKDEEEVDAHIIKKS